MAARHDHEIVRSDNVHVYLDHRHIGSGGDDSWSPSVHKVGVQAFECRLEGARYGDAEMGCAGRNAL